ncbi:class I SAM-dependent methyltransferase [Mycolicibacterium phlei]
MAESNRPRASVRLETARADAPTGAFKDRTTIHWIWRGVLLAIAVAIAVACYLVPVLLVVIAALVVVIALGRLIYRGRDRYVPTMYSKDLREYDEEYRTFVQRSLAQLRNLRIGGHTLLWEASRLPKPSGEPDPEELVLDLGVWIGWSTRLLADCTGRRVYGFDTFEGLVEDWSMDGQLVVKRGTFSLSDPLAKRVMRDTGVSMQNGTPTTLGRDVEFVRGSTYDTLVPFLAERPGAPIRLFHMDLDSYESCLHALETCKDRFVEGSILVFDEYLITNSEMRAFYEFQKRYGLEWRYRAWGLEIWEMNFTKVRSRFKRFVYYLLTVAVYWADGRFLWKFFSPRFWRFWLGAPVGDILFLLGAAGQRQSVSLEITGLGELGRAR